ncbi:MAG: DUF5666 domain-containing protein [Terriglobales bacterium]
MINFTIFRALVCAALVLLFTPAILAQQAPAPRAATRTVGTVKAIAGSTITLAADSGSELKVTVSDSTRLLRAAPGQKDLKDAAAITLQDIHVGDRMLVRGAAAADGSSVAASLALVMTRADLTERQQRDRADWQQRGVGGLVTAIDPAAGTVTLSTAGLGPAKTVTVRVSKAAIVRRYAPDSVKFDDATRATLDDIKPGDQLRARGHRSADGAILDAEELVAGSFRNIAGTVISADPALNTIVVMDLANRRPVTLRVAADSQLRALPPMLAQRIAARLRGTPAGENGPASGPRRSPPPNGRPGGGGDFQQMLERMSLVAPADLRKGDAVMIVTTQGTTSSGPTVITLLTGVEPILTASPNDHRAAMLLSPWNLGASMGDAE